MARGFGASMGGVSRAALGAALAAAVAASGAEEQQPSCTIVAYPECVYEGSAFEVRVRHALPASAGRAKLHCELKATDHVVLKGHGVLVEGAGQRTFRFLAPPRERTRRVLVAAWMGEHWRRALSPIQATPPIPVYPREALRMLEEDEAAAPRILERLGYARSVAGNVAIARDRSVGRGAALAEALGEAIAEASGGRAPAISFLDAAALSNPFVLRREHFDLLVLPDARAMPARAAWAIHRFLRQGGSLVAIGTPAFQRLLHRVRDAWLDTEQVRRAIDGTRPEHLLLRFEGGDLAGWRRATNRPKPAATYHVAPGGVEGRCLHAHVPALAGWDTWGSPPLERPFPEGHGLTCFWARGARATGELAIEWVERDGSRWIATVPLSTDWRHYALLPRDFRYWRDSPARDRGGSGDTFRPAQASRIVFGLAFTHTNVAPGEHEYWVDEVGTAPPPGEELMAVLESDLEPPPLDTLCPAYKFYPLTAARRFVWGERQAVVPPGPAPAPAQPRSSHVRPQGTGCQKGRPWRWIPLVEAVDGEGRRCGFPATLVVHGGEAFEGGAWAVFSYAPSEVAASSELRRAVGRVARRILDGVWLLEGGSRWYTCFADQEVALGATAANFGRRPVEAGVTLRIAPGGGGDAVFQRRFAARLEPGERRAWSAKWDAEGLPHAPYRVETVVEHDGRAADRLAHELNVWHPPADPSFVSARGQDLILRGKPWYVHGVNYMPSSGIAIERGPYFEYWLDPFPYDPDVVQTDLERVAALGLNTVSLFVYHRSIDSGNLLDVLRRCEALGLKVNLSLRPGTPLSFRWDEMRALIERYRLAHNDTVWAYDLAWEPQFRDHAARRVHDPAWRQWILDQYGSIEQAERDWGVACPREDGAVTNPSDEQVSRDGPWRAMVAAYRRFLDDLLAAPYARARHLVRSVDPHHLVSFRMSVAGDPTISHGHTIPYDFRATALGVDLVCPEGYGRTGSWERVRPGAFTVAYARCVAPRRPVMWAEFGRSIWDRRRGRPDPELAEWTGRFYEDFYRMALLAESSGTVCWWYPGGYRVGERSDYGIVNPDGSDRPAARVLRRYAARFAEPRPRSRPGPRIPIDRDAHPGGLPGIYEAVKGDFWRAAQAGRFPALRHAGQGTTSADCPAVAVGNVPATGHNPPKHLNAAFVRVRVREAGGAWRDVRSGDAIAAPPGSPVPARVLVGNTGFATWLAPRTATERKGTVRLVVVRGGRVVAHIPIPSDVPYLGEALLEDVRLPRSAGEPASFQLRMEARGRMAFGPVFRLRLRAPGR
ncbi:MAG: hypothetical protein ACLF0G_15760 [Candidatus Brocadiia bacterium]